MILLDKIMDLLLLTCGLFYMIKFFQGNPTDFELLTVCFLSVVVGRLSIRKEK